MNKFRIFYLYIIFFQIDCFATHCADIFLEQKYLDSVYASRSISIDGQLSDIKLSPSKKPYYINFEGPTSLKFKNKVLPDQGVNQHAHGFSSPIGKLKNVKKKLENLSPEELEQLGIIINNRVVLNYKSGVTVTGELTGVSRREGKVVLLTFEQATVKDAKNNILFDPSWGTYDMLVIDNLMATEYYKKILLNN